MSDRIIYSDNTEPREGCDLFVATRDVALVALRRQYEDSGFRVTGLEPADFGDCWLKLYEPPEIDTNGCTDNYPLDGPSIRCNVLGPGHHPGGKVWWLTPVDPVYVPVLQEVE
jgi:hypothetical protein